MKLLRIGFIALIACVNASLLQAQTADEIINKHIEAIGGKDVLSKIKSVYFEGTVSAMGADYPTNTTILAGKGFKSITTVNGTEIIQCFTDTSGWVMNPMAGQDLPVAVTPSQVEKSSSSLQIGGELFNYKVKGFLASLEGGETYQGVNAYKIKLTQPGIEIVYLIDPATYYILKKDSNFSLNGTEESNTGAFSNYKKTEAGYVVPLTLAVTDNGYDVNITYTKVEVNKEIDPNIFAMPK